jgi:hypothetical protein
MGNDEVLTIKNSFIGFSAKENSGSKIGLVNRLDGEIIYFWLKNTPLFSESM